MSCYGCGSPFSFFSKEHGCKNCGFAFCGKCLTKKISVPKHNNEKHHVCNKCYNILTGKAKEKASHYSPPEAHKKRVAALQERETGDDSASYRQKSSQNPVPSQFKSLSKAEREIAERLARLKEKSPTQAAAENVSEKEMRERLAKLKGQDPSIQSTSSKPFYKPPDRRTQQAQIDDLLDEIANEVELDSKLPDPVSQIESRLAKLKEKDQNNPEGQSNTHSKSTSVNKSDQQNNLNQGNDDGTQPFQQNIGCTSGSASQTNDEISVEEMQQLIAQATEENEREAQKALDGLQKDKEIMKQLRKVKSRDKEDVNKDLKSQEEAEKSDSDNENEEVLAGNLVQQLMEEDKLEEAALRDGINVNKTSTQKRDNNQSQQLIDDDELPYCTLCTEDATIRCHGCDLDLYCKRCWNESHKEFQMEDHVTSKYTPPKGYS